MSVLPQVSPDWLALRGAADDRARSNRLARRLTDLLPEGRQVIHDLGSGTGAMMRWLAPRLPGPQRWVLHDADAGILSHRFDGIVDAAGRPVIVDISVQRLDELTVADLTPATLVVASALLDVITRDEAQAIVDACVRLGVPALFSLTVTGDVAIRPAESDDELFRTAFNDHQRRDAGGRRLLGPDASGWVAERFAQSDWRVAVDRTPWRLDRQDGALIGEWWDGWLDAAVQQQPELRARVDAARERRRIQLAAGQLDVVIHHEDVLAWPA